MAKGVSLHIGVNRVNPKHRPSDMHRRSELCRQALASLTRDRASPLWAALQLKLGDSLSQDPLGERADNLERAIAHYEQALTVYAREAFPEQWAQGGSPSLEGSRVQG